MCIMRIFAYRTQTKNLSKVVHVESKESSGEVSKRHALELLHLEKLKTAHRCHRARAWLVDQIVELGSSTTAISVVIQND